MITIQINLASFRTISFPRRNLTRAYLTSEDMSNMEVILVIFSNTETKKQVQIIEKVQHAIPIIRESHK